MAASRSPGSASSRPGSRSARTRSTRWCPSRSGSRGRHADCGDRAQRRGGRRAERQQRLDLHRQPGPLRRDRAGAHAERPTGVHERRHAGDRGHRRDAGCGQHPLGRRRSRDGQGVRGCDVASDALERAGGQRRRQLLRRCHPPRRWRVHRARGPVRRGRQQRLRRARFRGRYGQAGCGDQPGSWPGGPDQRRADSLHGGLHGAGRRIR